MGEFLPTAEQQAIVDAAVCSNTSIMVKAYAGCAKTSTLKMLASAMKPQPALAIAFNKKIAQELEKALPSYFIVKTLNGLGHAAFSRGLGGRRLVLVDNKIGKIVSELFKKEKFTSAEDEWMIVRDWVNEARKAGIVHSSFLPRFRGLSEDSQANWESISNEARPSSELYEFAREALRISISQALDGQIDFDDQIYGSVCLGGVFPKFPLVLVDEAQDLSPLNHEQIKKVGAGRLIVVGDPKQCHPPGTEIAVTGIGSIPIEELSVGQEVVSFNSQKTYFPGVNSQGRKVLAINKFDFDGALVEIKAGNNKQLCTPNHKCLVRFNNKEVYCIYLMRKGNQYRVGVAQTAYSTGFGPALRARQEGAEALWILAVSDSKDAALIEEKVICCMFGLPDIMFMNNGKAVTTQKFLDAAWERIGDNSDRAYACLCEFKREINFPLWEADAENAHMGFYSFITQACNLIPDIMSVKVFNGDARDSNWHRIEIARVEYCGPVYGIEVEPAENGRRLYIADGIVTHNSIYGFRGAHTESMDVMQKLKPEWLDLPLHTTFRCPKIIVARSAAHAPGFRAFDTNVEGEAYWWRKVVSVQSASPEEAIDAGIEWRGEKHGGWSYAWLKSLRAAPTDRVFILCRNNAPLLSLAFKLIRQGIGPQMLGRDIGAGLVRLAKKISGDNEKLSLEKLVPLIKQWMGEEREKARFMEKEHLIAGIEDRGECLLATCENPGVKCAGDLEKILKNLFEREYGECLLATGHKIKGLEGEIVLVLDPWRIPSKFALRDARQLEQEMNLKYVMETRTRRVFVEANLEDFV